MVSDAPVPNAKQKTTVEVEKLVYGGDALARLSGHVVLMPFALPGEQVQIEPRRAKAICSGLAALEVLQPSLRRVKPSASISAGAAAASISMPNTAINSSRRAAFCRRPCGALADISV